MTNNVSVEHPSTCSGNFKNWILRCDFSSSVLNQRQKDVTVHLKSLCAFLQGEGCWGSVATVWKHVGTGVNIDVRNFPSSAQNQLLIYILVSFLELPWLLYIYLMFDLHMPQPLIQGCWHTTFMGTSSVSVRSVFTVWCSLKPLQAFFWADERDEPWLWLFRILNLCRISIRMPPIKLKA